MLVKNSRFATTLSGVLVLLALSSCDSVLEETPRSNLSPQNFYQTAEDAETALTGAYAQLFSGQNRGFPSGNRYYTLLLYPTAQYVSNNGQNDLDTWQWTSTTSRLEVTWNSLWSGLTGANAVIGNVPSIEMDEARKARILGQARFLRAWHYFTLLRLWGGVPLRRSVPSGLDSLNLERASADETYDFIIQDLTRAVETLPPGSEMEVGRASRGAAQALLAKVYLQRGSSAACEMCGTADATAQPEDLQNAARLLEEVMDSGEYRLVDDYASLFQLETETNDEAIFVVRHSSRTNNGESVQNWINPPNSGWFFGSYTVGTAEIPFYASYEEEDLRRVPSWVTEYVDQNGVTHTYDLGDPDNDTYGPVAPTPEKAILRRSDIGGWATNPLDTPVFRYADVLLMYAEALNETNGGPTETAYDAINQVRSRAGLSDLEGGLSYEGFRDALFNEFRWELTQEYNGWYIGQRYFDRFVEAVRSNFEQRDNLPATAVPLALSIDLPAERIFPLPQSALDQNPNLVQNPGY